MAAAMTPREPNLDPPEPYDDDQLEAIACNAWDPEYESWREFEASVRCEPEDRDGDF